MAHIDEPFQHIGQYVVGEPLNKGNAVHLRFAAHDTFGDVYLMKILPLGSLMVDGDYNSAEGRARFFEEFKALKSCQHPNIPLVFDYDPSGFQPYYIMEYFEGRELSIAKHDISLGVHILKQVSSALHHLHEHGFVHRDISHRNVLLGEDNHVMLIDPIPWIDVYDTSRKNSIGNPTLKSPEAICRKVYLPSDDIYSLGALGYRLLTGRDPFPSIHPVIMSLEDSEWYEDNLPSLVNPLIPHALEEILIRALARQRTDRYQSAGELLAALQAVHLE